MKKLFDVVGVILVGVFSFFLFLGYIVCSDYVSNGDYARMAQELVDQSLDQDACQNKEGHCLK